jgi:2,3-bisphosphoglycerate-independent phosphoglycerate mutase
MKKLFLFFIDGIGLCQQESPLSNLFTKITGKNLIAGNQPDFFDSGVICSADATLNVPGRPQSATGQAAIFTGINASEYLGYHLTALPNEKLVELIEKQSLMKSLAENGISVTSANMYSKEFFQKRAARRRNAFPVSTLTIKASGVPFRYYADYDKGEAVFADITNRLIRERGYDIEEIFPEKAAGNLLNILEANQFVFFEYFMTDVYGHKRNKEKLEESVDILNRFTETVWSGIKENDTAMLIISDHGNAEDLTTGNHTTNNVPAILLTKNIIDTRKFAESIHSLVDIYPWVLEYFSSSKNKSD